MNFQRSSLRLAIAIAFVGSDISMVQALPVGELIAVKGPAEYREKSQDPWRAAMIKQKIEGGAYVKTGDLASAAILFTDQTQIRLTQNSLIQVKGVATAQGGESLLELAVGRAWMQSKSVPDRLRLQTPNAVAAIRGTDWEVEVTPDGRTTLTVLSGVVDLSNDLGRVVVGKHEQAVVVPGQAPVKRQLLNPRERVQWVSSFTLDSNRYPDLLTRPTGDPARHAVDTLAQQRYAETQSALTRALGEAAAPVSVHLLAADLQIYLGQYDQALEVLAQALQRHPDEPRLLAQRVRVLMLADRLAEARGVLAEAEKRLPDQIELALVRGELERLDGQAAATVTAYQRAATLAPNDARVWLGWGAVEAERENLRQARQWLDRAAALDPRLAGLLGERASLDSLSLRLDDARQGFNAALAEAPADYVALTGRGLAELKSGQLAEALDTLLRATVLEPKFARAHIYLAVAYYQNGQAKAALDTLDRAAELDPRDPLPFYLRAAIHADRFEAGATVRAAREALLRMPYLKSLNQLANNQKGTANLGYGLALFGLEEWAQAQAHDAYYAFWGGSHLFLADRYTSDYKKNSELFQGYLTDPLAFGASNRAADLIARPVINGSVGLQATESRDAHARSFEATVNGLSTQSLPWAYFVQAGSGRQNVDPVSNRSDFNSLTVALGAQPAADVGLFLLADRFRANTDVELSGYRNPFIDGGANRLDLGANIKWAAAEQMWLKLGAWERDATSIRPVVTSGQFAWQTTTSTPASQDLQWRYSRMNDHGLEWSLGLEHAHGRQPSRSRFDYPGFNVVDGVHQDAQDRSTDLYASIKWTATAQTALQADVFWQDYEKDRAIFVYRDIAGNRVSNRNLTEQYRRRELQPRLGMVHRFADDLTIRAAYQRWQKPAQFNTLSPVDTAGLPLEDSMVLEGGKLTRYRAQLEWRQAQAFVSAFVGQDRVNNLVSALSGVLNTQADLSQIAQLRNRSVVNLANMDLLEGPSTFASGRLNQVGVAWNGILDDEWGAYARYRYTRSENDSAGLADKWLPFQPRHRLTGGFSWISPSRWQVGTQLTWRSLRYVDEANSQSLQPGWDLAVKAYWESNDKRWAVETFAANLLKKQTDRIWGINLQARF